MDLQSQRERTTYQKLQLPILIAAFVAVVALIIYLHLKAEEWSRPPAGGAGSGETAPAPKPDRPTDPGAGG
jgi:hypothetical protein